MAALALRQEGSAAVEFALMVPVFLFMMVATAEIGRALYEYNTLTKSVRDAAQYLARECMQPVGHIDLAACGKTEQAKALVVYGNPAGTGAKLIEGLDVDGVEVAEVGTPPLHVHVEAKYRFVAKFPIQFIDTGKRIDSPGELTAAITMRGL